MNFEILTYKYRQQGNLSWTYRPFFNYRKDNKLNELDTTELKFSFKHPVSLLPLPSYDGSVNLIINDGISPPKLINNRFSPTGKNTYKIVDRRGNSDANIYDAGELFEIDTSLYKMTSKIPKITLLGTTYGGNLKIGNYFFYFKLADADGNETDFIGQSKLVSIFIGEGNFNSVTTGTKNLNSHKIVRFELSDLDTAYSYISVYYSRTTASDGEKHIIQYKKILKQFVITNSYQCRINITGFEDEVEITDLLLNAKYNIVDCAKTHAQLGGRLFLGNVKKRELDYDSLIKYSINIVPELESENYFNSNMITPYEDNINKFIDVNYIYDNLGYAPGEFYRFGIVYILSNGELSPVFNIRGGRVKYGTTGIWKYIDSLSYDDSNNLITGNNGEALYLNTKGVVYFEGYPELNNYKIKFTNLNTESLPSGYKGFFFVRLKRINLCLATGLTLGVDKVSHTPTIPIGTSNISGIVNNTSNTYLLYKTEPDKPVYISEGFLSRYNFRFAPKKASFASTFLKAGLIVAGVAACVVATVYGGPAGLALSAKLLGTTAAVTMPGSAVLVGAAIATGAAATTVATAYQVEAIYNKANAALANTGKTGVVDGRSIKTPTGTYRKEEESSRKLIDDYESHIIIKDSNKTLVIICPEFALNPYKYNLIFNGSKHYVEEIKFGNNSTTSLGMHGRHFYPESYVPDADENSNGGNFKIIPVDDGLQVAAVDDLLFRGRAGNAEEAYTYECIGEDYKSESNKDELSNKKINSDIIRGNFGAYLGFTNKNEKIRPAKLVKIYIPNYSMANFDNYMSIRMTDSSPFYAISDRYYIDKLVPAKEGETVGALFIESGGDSYLCEFTHRINRNFNDPSLPYNDIIVDEDCWKDNYNPANEEDLEKINLSDVNAVKLGMWVSFRCRSNYNLNIRTLDGLYADEANMLGHPRTYYPYDVMSVEGSFKTPESRIYNQGFAESTSSLFNFELPNVPALKSWYGTRIMYSELHVTDAFRNGYRVFLGTTYRDYGNLYGEITKLLDLKGHLVIVFEHGIGIMQPLPKERPNAQLTPYNLLPEFPLMLSDTYGSQWVDSIIKTDLYIYGVDTCAKKIWRTDGSSVQGLSDHSVQEFLNNNLTLSETEKEPIVGIRNVATFFNADKLDVMFTFYDCRYTYEEVAWNLCFNEQIGKFITFYSWIPVMMENIDNIPFSFDRNVSKLYANLGNTRGDVDTGIKLATKTESLVDQLSGETTQRTVTTDLLEYYENGELVTGVTFTLVKDPWNNYKSVSINGNVLTITNTDAIFKSYKPKYDLRGRKIINDDVENTNYNNLNPYLYIRVIQSDTTNKNKDNETDIISIDKTYLLALKNPSINSENGLTGIVSDFWKHGHAGIIDVKDEIKPAAWYGFLHPFEFEFVVVDHPEVHKIFTNLELIANKTKPESFHYEVIGECYDFAKDKPNMYFRQEATKALWLYNGVDITYDHDIINILPLHLNPRSAELIKTYYERLDHINTIEDYYVHKGEAKPYDYRHLSGAEIVRYKKRGEYRIWSHSLAVSMDELRLDDARSLIAANCNYTEDRWRVVINPVLVCYKNEYNNKKSTWFDFLYLKNGAKIEKDEFNKSIEDATYSPNRDIYTVGLDEYRVVRLPKLTIFNSAIPKSVQLAGEIKTANLGEGTDDIFNVAYTNIDTLDDSKWMDDSSIYKTNFGAAQNRKEVDLKDRFIKVRIRYKGDELAIIDYINTIYQESYS